MSLSEITKVTRATRKWVVKVQVIMGEGRSLKVGSNGMPYEYRIRLSLALFRRNQGEPTTCR
jgi:hypothetical protein